MDEVDRMDAVAWTDAGETVLSQDRTLSNWLAGVRTGRRRCAMAANKHYSIRYTEVMAVDSDFVLAEKGDYKNLGARGGRLFESILPSLGRRVLR